jgi:hypothetical protein
MRSFIEAGVSVYSQWNSVLDQTGLSGWGWSQCSPVTVDTTTQQVTYEGSYWATKHFSFFVEPGAVRLEASGDLGLCVLVNGACGCDAGCQSGTVAATSSRSSGSIYEASSFGNSSSSYEASSFGNSSSSNDGNEFASYQVAAFLSAGGDSVVVVVSNMDSASRPINITVTGAPRAVLAVMPAKSFNTFVVPLS